MLGTNCKYKNKLGNLEPRNKNQNAKLKPKSKHGE